MSMQRLTVPALLACLFAVLLWAAGTGTLNVYWQSVLMFMGVNIILATSLNIINGNMGEFSCGHAGFMAVGAYVSSLLSVALFISGQTLGGIVFLVLAFLVSPFGVPAIAEWLVDKLHSAKFTLRDFITG